MRQELLIRVEREEWNKKESDRGRTMMERMSWWCAHWTWNILSIGTKADLFQNVNSIYGIRCH